MIPVPFYNIMAWALDLSDELSCRLLVIARSRDVNLRDVLSHSLGPVSFSLVSTACCIDDVPSDSVLILDAMAIIHALNQRNLPGTFGELAQAFLLSFFRARHGGHKGVDVVADTYPRKHQTG